MPDRRRRGDNGSSRGGRRASPPMRRRPSLVRLDVRLRIRMVGTNAVAALTIRRPDPPSRGDRERRVTTRRRLMLASRPGSSLDATSARVGPA